MSLTNPRRGFQQFKRENSLAARRETTTTRDESGERKAESEERTESGERRADSMYLNTTPLNDSPDPSSSSSEDRYEDRCELSRFLSIVSIVSKRWRRASNGGFQSCAG